MICIRTFSNSLLPSNIWYQTRRPKRQHTWFIFWTPRVQTSASIPTIISEDSSTSFEVRLSPSTQFQLCRDSVLKQVAECLLQLQSSGMWRRAHSWADRYEFRRNRLPSIFRVECFLKSWNNFFCHLKGWAGLELRVNWQGMVTTGDSGRRA